MVVNLIPFKINHLVQLKKGNHALDCYNMPLFVARHVEVYIHFSFDMNDTHYIVGSYIVLYTGYK